MTTVTSPTPDRETIDWSQADAHALAATALLDDPSVPPWTAAEHLRQGFSALARAAGIAEPASVAELDLGALPWIAAPHELAEPLRSLGTADDTTIDVAMLRRLALALSHAVTTAGDACFASTRRRDHRRRLLGRALMGVMIFIPIAVGVVLTMPDYREGPWRAEYFPTIDFTGDPVVDRVGDIDFAWHRGSPIPELPKDVFSARFDTCMVLSEDLEIAFQLISDDGSRLFIDDQLVVDNWGTHDQRSRGADVPVAAGTHHLRIDYFEDHGAAKLELRASLRGELPAPLPVRLLHHPGDDPDDPCATR